MKTVLVNFSLKFRPHTKYAGSTQCVCALLSLWMHGKVMLFSLCFGDKLSFGRRLSHAPQLALKSPQSQIKVSLTPGPLTY